MSNNQHVGVIGAGIIGLCTALALQKKGYSVTIIDKSGVASECSKGNAGHFATEQVFPLADAALLPQLPKMLLDPLGPFRIKPSYFFKALPWFVRFLNNMRSTPYAKSQKSIKQLNQLSISAFNELLKPLNLEHIIELKGSILTFESTPDSQIKQKLSQFHEHGVDVDWLDYKQALALEPNLSPRVKSVFYFKTGGHTADPELMCNKLAEKFTEHGGKLIIDCVEQITTHQSETKVTIKASQQNHHFDNIVLATGAWSKTFAKQLGYDVPLDTERGYNLMVKQTGLLNRPVSSAERKFIMTPMAEGLRLAGTVEFAGLKAPLNPKRANILIPHAQHILNELPTDSINKVSNPWMGFRPSLPDSLPVIGRSPKNTNVYFAFGHHHLGLTHGAITGQLIAEQMSGEQTTLDLTSFCISRFA